MSVTYPLYNYSSFPDSIDQFDRFTDLTLDTIEYAKQYNAYMNKGDLSNAAKILIDHPELKTSLINAANLNRIIDAIKCIETFYAEDIQRYLINIIKFRGEYSSSTKYLKYDVVMYNNLGYLCISSDTPIGTVATNTAYFVPLTLQGEQGIAGVNLTFEGTWDSKVTYSSDSCVTYNNILYASLTDNNLAKTPSKTSSYWTVVIDFDLLTTYDNSSSGLNSVSLQNAIDEVNAKVNTNKNNISINTSNITSNTNKIADINNRISKINNTADKDKEVKYAVSAGSATSATSATNANYATSAGSANTATSAITASTCTGNSATATKATNADYATSSGNSDSVDGYHFTVSNVDLTAGTSSLTTNTFYFVYE